MIVIDTDALVVDTPMEVLGRGDNAVGVEGKEVANVSIVGIFERLEDELFKAFGSP